MSILEQLRLLHPGWSDALEIAIVSVALYRVLLLIHRTRAMQVLAGIIVLAVAFGLAYLLQLSMIVYLLKLIFSYGAIALLVVFAPELRAALAQIGRSPMSRFFSHMAESEIADEIAEAVERLSRSGIGAIVDDRARGVARGVHRFRIARCRRRCRPICWRRSSRRIRRCTTAP